MNILIIDDSEPDQKTVCEYLSQSKCKNTITTAETMEEGRGQLQSFHFDLVFLDLFLPDSEGIETVKTALECVKTSTENKDTPIIVLTGNEDYSIGKAAVKMGVKDFLIKDNITPKQLSRAVSFATFLEQLPRKMGIINKTKNLFIGLVS